MFLETDPDRWIQLERVDSTSSFLQREDHPGGTVVLAREQTAGRGTHGRPWFALPDRSFIFSALLTGSGTGARIPLERLVYLPLLVGMGVLEAARSVQDRLEPGDARRFGIKWPNDVMLDDGSGWKKLAGVLVESEISGDGEYRVVIGVGLNWFGVPGEVTNDIGMSVSAMPVALFSADPGQSPFTLTASLIERINDYLPDLLVGGAPSFLDKVRRHCCVSGRMARIDGEVCRVRGIADSGGLLVESPSGQVEEVVGRSEPLVIVD